MTSKNQQNQWYSRFLSKKYIVPAAIIAVLIVALAGYFYYKAEEARRNYRGATVEVTKVRQGSIERKINAVGSLTANQSVVIRPQVSGIIKEVHFKGGDKISEGDILVSIDDRLYQAQLKEAQAKLKLARINFERKQKLFEKNATAQAKLDEAKSQLGVAEANVELTKIKLGQTEVRAPFDGVAGIKMISAGDSVNEQKELLAFVDVDPMKIDFKVAANYVQLLSVGQKVKVKVDGFGEKLFDARIVEIDARIDPQTHSLSVRARIPNKYGLLKPGLFGRVIFVAGSKDETLLVPSICVDVSGDEEFVYRVVKRRGFNVAEKVTVTTGIKADEVTEIVRGLKEGDVVVTSGQVKLQDSSIVRPIGLENGDEPKDEDESEDKPKDKKDEKKDDKSSDKADDKKSDKKSDDESKDDAKADKD